MDYNAVRSIVRKEHEQSDTQIGHSDEDDDDNDAIAQNEQEDCNDPKANDSDSDDNVVLPRKRKLETQPALQADSSKMRKTIATTGLADFVAKMRCMQMRFLLCSLSCCYLLF